MQLILTERQLRTLKSQRALYQLLRESDDPAAAAPEAGTSSDGEKKTGATKWETGITRGPANQIGVTKWSDIVGASLKRGHANPLTEQAEQPTILSVNGKKMKVPMGTKVLTNFTQTEIDGGGFIRDSLRYWYSKQRGGEGNTYTEEWLPDDWSNFIQLNSVAQFQTSDGKIYSARLTHPKLDAIAGQPMKKFYELTPDPNGWRFNGYFDKNGKPYTGAASMAYASGKEVGPVEQFKDAQKVSNYVYKADDGEGFFVNMMKGEFSEALLDLRTHLFTPAGMTVQTVVEVVFSETIIVPVAIEVINAAILLNDLDLWVNQEEEDPEAFWRFIEDCGFYLLRGAAWGAGKGIKAFIKTPAGQKAILYILQKISGLFELLGKLIQKLPGKGLRTYVQSLLPSNSNKIIKAIKGAAGIVASTIPAKFRRAIVSGLLVYVSAKGLERLLGVKEGTIDAEMANGGVPSDELTAKIESVLPSTISAEDIQTAKDLEIIGANDQYTIKLAEFFKDTYPCLTERVKNKTFIVAIHTEEKDIYKIDGVEYINEGMGIQNTQTGEDFKC